MSTNSIKFDKLFTIVKRYGNRYTSVNQPRKSKLYMHYDGWVRVPSGPQLLKKAPDFRGFFSFIYIHVLIAQQFSIHDLSFPASSFHKNKMHSHH